MHLTRNLTTRPRETEWKTHRKSRKRPAKSKGKQPVKPMGFQAAVPSISVVGLGWTVSRHERLIRPTAVTFKCGNNNIPHSLRFLDNGNKDQAEKEKEQKDSHSDVPNENGGRGQKQESPGRPSRKGSVSSSSNSSLSDSTYSESSTLSSSSPSSLTESSSDSDPK